MVKVLRKTGTIHKQLRTEVSSGVGGGGQGLGEHRGHYKGTDDSFISSVQIFKLLFFVIYMLYACAYDIFYNVF